MANQIDTGLEKQIAEEEIQVSRGSISEMAKKYVLSTDNLLRAVQRMGRRYSFDVLRARILLNRHGAHRMKPFRQVNKKHHVAEEGMSYGLPSTEMEPDEISRGIDTSTLLDLIEKGEVWSKINHRIQIPAIIYYFAPDPVS